MLWIDILKIRIQARFNKDLDPRIVELHIATLKAWKARQTAIAAAAAVLGIAKADRKYANRNMTEQEIGGFILNQEMPLTDEYREAEKSAKALELAAAEKLIPVLKKLKESGLQQQHPLYQSITKLVEVSNLG